MSVLSNSSVAELSDEIKQFVSNYGKEIAKLGRADAELLSKLDKLDTAVIEMHEKYDGAIRRADEIEARMHTARSVQRETRGLADVLLGSKEFGRVTSLGRGEKISIGVSAKDILGLGVEMPQTISAIASGPRQRIGVRDLLPVTETRSGAVQFLRETSFTNAAAPVAEGALKPKSDATYDVQTRVIETIAHYFKVSKQSYDDVAGLAAEIESNLLYGLDLKVEQQLLKGSGLSPELTGLYPAATAATAAPGGSTIIDTLFLAVAELAGKGYSATGIVMGPTDQTSMILLKDLQGRYLYGSTVPLPRIVVSPIMAPGQWLVGDFSKSRLFVREGGSVQVASQNEDDFVHNRLTALGEVRMALAIYRADALLKNPAA